MDMMERRTQEYEIQLGRTSDELRVAKGQVVKVSEQESALVQQNAKMSVELVAKDKRLNVLESDLKSTRGQLKEREDELTKMKEEAKKMQSRHDGVAGNLGKELEEKNKTVKEYQDKVCLR